MKTISLPSSYFIGRWFSILLVVLVFRGCLILAFGTVSPQYISRLWQMDEGLPHNSVQAIAQTRDGYLWVGTAGGLARFDGMRFTVFDQKTTPEIRGHSVTALCEGQDGSFWIGTDSGLTRLKDGTFSHYGQTNGLASDSVRTIFESRDGSIWIGTTGGLTRYHEGKFTSLTERDGLAQNAVRSVCEDQEGNIWIATGGGLNRLKEKIIETIDSKNWLPNNSMHTVYGDRNGILWAGSDNGLSRIPKFGNYALIHTWNHSHGLSDNIISAIYEDRRGNLWIGTYAGLNQWPDAGYDAFPPKKERAFLIETKSDGTAYDQVNVIMEDHEGNIWVGTKEGLSRLKIKPFTAYTKQQGLTHDNVTSIYEDNAETLWIATWGGGLNRLKDGNITAYTTINGSEKGLVADLLLSVHQDHAGDLWIGADYDGGLFRFKDGRFTRYDSRDGLTNSAVRVIYEDQQGNFWIGTSKALVLFKNGKFIHYTTQDGLAGNTVRAILEDDEGNLWIGTNDGLSRRRDEKFSSFTTQDGLSNNRVVALYEDKEKNLWIGTQGGGLNRFHGGKFTSYTTKQGLFSDDIFEILEDDYGYLWMSCLNGIFRINKKSLDDFDRGKIGIIRCISYGKNDGMVSAQCNGVSKPAGWKSRDGRLWFPTTKGVVVADPSIKVNDMPPPVVIEEVMADKKIQSQTPGGSSTLDFRHRPLDIEPGRGELEFHYTALSFSAPEKNRFKYKLEGADSEWMDAGTRRIAYYNNLYPGNYRFRVIACNNDGVWNETGASLALVLLPHFWQTKWFIGLMAFASIGFVASTARYITWKKVQRKLELLEQQHAIDKERTRIAQDMHDDLGATLTRISYLGELTKRDAREPDQVLSHADHICGVSRDLVQAMDEIVWAVNPRNDNLRQLAGYIFQYAEEFLSGTELRLRKERPNILPEIPFNAETRHNIFLVVKEALNNSVKHAKATEVRLSLDLVDSQLRVGVEDDGCGFGTMAGDGFSNGLNNMRKRVEEIGGCFQVESRTGKGTKIKFTVPVARPSASST